MKGKGSLGAIGAMALAFLGFFRRGCDDVARVASDIPYNQVDEFPFEIMDDATRYSDSRRFMRNESDFRKEYFSSDELVTNGRTADEIEAAFEKAYAVEMKESSDLLMMTMARRSKQRGSKFIKTARNISKRANGVICIREDGTVNITYTLASLGTAQVLGAGVGVQYHLVDSASGGKALGPDCLYKQGICLTLKNGKVGLDRSRTIECDYGSLTLGGSSISLSSDTETLQLPVQVNL